MKTYRKDYINQGKPETIIVDVHFDDRCSNGHKTFSITGAIYTVGFRRGEESVEHKSGKKVYLEACGCIHDEIAIWFPELIPLIKWHLTSTEGPMHYLANAKYWFGASGWCGGKPSDPPNLDHFRSTVVFGSLPEDTETLEKYLAKHDPKDWPHVEQLLINRLPALLRAFQLDMEKLGFSWND